jgi:DNA-binding NarL/FixJ family response regulator
LHPIRILLGPLPPRVRDALERSLSAHADMEVVGAVTTPIEVLLAVGRTSTDVVLLGLEDGDLPGIASHLLDEYPAVRVLAVSSDLRQALLYELRPHLVHLGEVSPDGLAEAIRTAVRSEIP